MRRILCIPKQFRTSTLDLEGIDRNSHPYFIAEYPSFHPLAHLQLFQQQGFIPCLSECCTKRAFVEHGSYARRENDFAGSYVELEGLNSLDLLDAIRV